MFAPVNSRQRPLPAPPPTTTKGSTDLRVTSPFRMYPSTVPIAGNASNDDDETTAVAYASNGYRGGIVPVAAGNTVPAGTTGGTTTGGTTTGGTTTGGTTTGGTTTNSTGGITSGYGSSPNDYMYYGDGQGQVSTQAVDPDALFARITREQEQYYQDYFRPLNQRLIDDVDSTKLIDAAKDNAAKNNELSALRAARMDSRYGTSNTALDRSRRNYLREHEQGLDEDHLVNTARAEQYERNYGLRAELLNLSRGISKDATSGLGFAAKLKASRDATNSQIDAQNDAAKDSQTATAISAVLSIISMIY